MGNASGSFIAVKFSCDQVLNESIECVIMKVGAAQTVSLERRGMPCWPAPAIA